MVGMNIRKKMPISLKPSIRAASMMSCGKLLAACRNIRIRNGVDTDGRTRAQKLLIMCHWENILNSGIMIATNGSIMASSRMRIRASFPLSW